MISRNKYVFWLKSEVFNILLDWDWSELLEKFDII